MRSKVRHRKWGQRGGTFGGQCLRAAERPGAIASAQCPGSDRVSEMPTELWEGRPTQHWADFRFGQRPGSLSGGDARAEHSVSPSPSPPLSAWPPCRGLRSPGSLELRGRSHLASPPGRSGTHVSAPTGHSGRVSPVARTFMSPRPLSQGLALCHRVAPFHSVSLFPDLESGDGRKGLPPSFPGGHRGKWRWSGL